MATTSDIKNGLMIRLNNEIYEVIDFLHVKPGKGQAFVRTKLKGVTSGKVVDKTFPAGSSFEDVPVVKKNYQYLYQEDDNTYVFMDMETYDQIPVRKEQISAPEFLTEGLECLVLFDASTDRVLKVELPKTVDLEVEYTEPGIKGDTVSNTTKPARLVNGIEIKVPLFINIGDVVTVDTTTKKYLGRAKK